jgi:energy-converting hydrogenase B subunit D
MTEFLLMIVPVLIIGVGFLVVRFDDLLAAIVSLAVLSLLVSLQFYLMRAPDVAITEAAIGAALSTAIYLLALKAISRKGAEKVE